MQDKNLEKENTQVEAEKKIENCDGSITIKWKAIADANELDFPAMDYQIIEKNVDVTDVLNSLYAYLMYAVDCKKAPMKEIAFTVVEYLEDYFDHRQVKGEIFDALAPHEVEHIKSREK